MKEAKPFVGPCELVSTQLSHNETLLAVRPLQRIGQRLQVVLVIFKFQSPRRPIFSRLPPRCRTERRVKTRLSWKEWKSKVEEKNFVLQIAVVCQMSVRVVDENGAEEGYV